MTENQTTTCSVSMRRIRGNRTLEGDWYSEQLYCRGVSSVFVTEA